MEAAPETVQVAMGRHLDVALSAGQAMMLMLGVRGGKAKASKAKLLLILSACEKSITNLAWQRQSYPTLRNQRTMGMGATG
eukprot:scaffold145909_cov14-Tisochrysis_lutea.AAC.2